LQQAVSVVPAEATKVCMMVWYGSARNTEGGAHRQRPSAGVQRAAGSTWTHRTGHVRVVLLPMASPAQKNSVLFLVALV
jgi:hypothetical protein